MHHKRFSKSSWQAHVSWPNAADELPRIVLPARGKRRFSIPDSGANRRPKYRLISGPSTTF
jgi:hypothetical protein